MKKTTMIVGALLSAALVGCGPDACSRATDKCDDACPVTVEVTYCFPECMAAEGDPCNAKDEETTR